MCIYIYVNNCICVVYKILWPLTFYSGMYSDIRSGILCGIYTDSFSGILSGIFSTICSDMRSGMLSGILSDILFWRSIWYIFGDSLWSRSGGEHSDPEVAVRVRQGHCDLALADSPSSVVFSMGKTKNHLEIPYLEQTQVQISEITQKIQTMIPTYSTMARDSPWSLWSYPLSGCWNPNEEPRAVANPTMP